MSTFKEMNLTPEIQKTLEDLGFLHPTEIQKKAIPLLLESDKIDFHGQAQTGTGKTLAFAIPLLQRMNAQEKSPQALVVAPTRELAVQIYDAVVQISKNMNIKVALVYGGVSIENQIDAIRRGVQIIIGTPGRIRDHLQRRTLNLKNIRTLVLDEADIMLDMGFKEEIDDILNSVPKDREIWLFSATIKPGIDQIKREQMNDPVVVQVSKRQVVNEKTEQFYCVVPFKARLHAVIRFIQSARDFYGIIFCQTKILASEIADELTRRGYGVGALHGDLGQDHRNMVIKKFKQKDFKVLVATDVAARGIDVPNLTYVINYSIPEDLESYVHRIGRTGRAGQKGVAITFLNKSDIRLAKNLERRFGIKINPIDVPSKQMLVDIALADVSAYVAAERPVMNFDKDLIMKLIDGLEVEPLREILANLLFQKFISTLDLEDIPYTHIEPEAGDEFQEVFLNLGMDDGISPMDVKNYLLETGVVTEDQIKKIRVIKRRTFIKLATDCSPDLLNALRQKTLNGRKVSANLTCFVQGPAGEGRPGGSRDGGNFRSRPRGPRSNSDRDGGPRRRSSGDSAGRSSDRRDRR